MWGEREANNIYFRGRELVQWLRDKDEKKTFYYIPFVYLFNFTPINHSKIIFNISFTEIMRFNYLSNEFSLSIP